jgi:hypothetical protein
MAKTIELDITKEIQAARKALDPALKRLVKDLRGLDPKKFPIGAVADLLYDLRGLAPQLSVVTAQFDDVIGPAAKLVQDYFIDALKVGEASGVQGRYSRVQITDNPVPTVADWKKFYAHIKKSGEFELLNRAVNRAAVKERWDAKKQVPGVTVFHDKKVSCTKLNGKGTK